MYFYSYILYICIYICRAYICYIYISGEYILADCFAVHTYGTAYAYLPYGTAYVEGRVAPPSIKGNQRAINGRYTIGNI